MAVLHRALCTWFICLIFLILLVLQLDERTRWSWFIVFIPMWIYDSILILYLLFNMTTHCKNGHDGSLRTMKRKIWCFVCIVLKLTAQIMLCLKLENNDRSIYIPLYYVMIPIWIILAISTVDIFFTLISNRSA
uniref:Transmembrane protein 60 n=1 Tax=Lepeophtheirus salmonis TaxID=72036 RepID=D3PGQ8_LEPSM|nr:Transmembrane protein 60 [Lepeophtheirus salmonis]